MFGEVVNGVTIAHVIALEDHLVRNCSAQPVPTGGGAIGAHVVLVRGIDHDAVYRNGTIVMLSFEDFTGRKYEFTKVMPGEIKTPVSPIGLQE